MLHRLVADLAAAGHTARSGGAPGRPDSAAIARVDTDGALAARAAITLTRDGRATARTHHHDRCESKEPGHRCRLSVPARAANGLQMPGATCAGWRWSRQCKSP